MRAATILAALVLLFSLGFGAAEKAETNPPDSRVQPAAEPVMTAEEKADAELGKAAAEEVEKKYKVVEDSPDAARIMRIIEQIRPFTEKPHQKYQAKVLDTPEINAFSLPGGYLYYARGLLEAVESEDELAAITAHEMAHGCLNHARRLMGKDARYTKGLVAAIVASLLIHSENVDPGNVAMLGGLLVQDAVNHYSREAEMEADRAGVTYLLAGKHWNPVAMLTVVEGLARMEASRASVDPGVFQTHPVPTERAAAVTEQLKALSIPIERRRVTKSLVASAKTVMQDGKEIGELGLNGRVVALPAVPWEGASAVERAQRGCDLLNEMLLADLQALEIGVTRENGAAGLTARGETILMITPGDAEFHGATVDDLLEQATAAVRAGFHDEKIQRAF